MSSSFAVAEMCHLDLFLGGGKNFRLSYLMFVTRCRIYLGRLGIGSVKFFEIAA